ncbi:MAG TPA: HD domain-containing phosphohydrolase [Gemmatimonas sp.]|nr:HD domain-containing phosphohydrolase [Gemmatimonas sp.]
MTETPITTSSPATSCLIVDDEPALRTILRRVLEADGFACSEASSGVEAIRMLEATHIPLVISDYHMPEMDGGELLRTVRVRWPDTSVVIITAASDVDLAVRCLEAGALDYLTKPFGLDELRARLRQAFEKRRLVLENLAYRTLLEERVLAQTRKYEDLFLAALQSLAEALEVKDSYTWGHSTRVSRYAMAIARELGLPTSLLEEIEYGSRLHDIGKIGIREAVLNKDGPLTDEEYAHVMEHPVIGWRLLAPLMREMPHALAIVRSHHERIDGKGGPDGLCGTDIPMEARITAVADSFDAMTSGRPYRAGVSAEVAIAELRRCAGTQFCTECVAAFERVLESGALPWPDRNTQRPVRSLQIVA